MKNTTINIIENRRESFDKIYPFINKVNNSKERIEQIKAHTNATLLAIAEGEVARLEIEKACFYNFKYKEEKFTNGHNTAINNQISHWEQVISFLNK